MSNGIYGGEDVNAVVIDCGRYSVRCGMAGEDTCKFELPSRIGFIEGLDENEPSSRPSAALEAVARNGSSAAASEAKKESTGTDKESPPDADMRDLEKSMHYVNKKYIIRSLPHGNIPPKENVVFKGILDQKGLIEDWDAYENMLHFIYGDCICSESKYTPTLITEPINITKEKREKLAEIMFEKFNVPALFLAKSPVLACFANGKHSALVLDSGFGGTTCCPVQDGFALPQCSMSIPIGGDYLSKKCVGLLNEFCPAMGEIIPPYKIGMKDPVEMRQPPKFQLKKNLPNVTANYDDAMVEEVIDDFKRACLKISDVPISEANPDTLASAEYEFPNGYRHEFGTLGGLELYQIGEQLFDPSKAAVDANQQAPSSLLGLGQIVTTVLGNVEMDIRQAVGSNLVVTGGQSGISGFVDRLQREVSIRTPSSVKMKVIHSGEVRERIQAAWVGGSILASLGSFQSFWFSQAEYQDQGKAFLQKKCP